MFVGEILRSRNYRKKTVLLYCWCKNLKYLFGVVNLKQKKNSFLWVALENQPSWRCKESLLSSYFIVVYPDVTILWYFESTFLTEISGQNLAQNHGLDSKNGKIIKNIDFAVLGRYDITVSALKVAKSSKTSILRF